MRGAGGALFGVKVVGALAWSWPTVALVVAIGFVLSLAVDAFELSLSPPT